MAEVGVVITLKDTATKGLSSVRGAVAKLKSGFGALGGVMSKINQGLEVAKKAWEVLRMAVVDNVQAALAFRKANDPVLKWFRQMKADTDALRAAIGDLFIPVVMGLAEAFGLVGDGAARFIDANRVLISSKILEWSLDLGKALTTVVAKGAWAIVKAWAGWQEIVLLTTSVVDKGFEKTIQGIEAVLRGLQWVNDLFGDTRSKAGQYADRIHDLGLVFGQSGDEAEVALAKMVASTDAQIAKLDELEEFVRTKLGNAYLIALQKVREFSTGAREAVGEVKDALVALAELNATHTDIAIANINRELDARLRAIDRQTKEEEEAAKLKQQWLDNQLAKAKKVSDLITEAVGAGLAAQENQAGIFGKKLLSGLVDRATASIAVYAAEAAALAMANVPFPAGFIAAGIASAAVLALGAGLSSIVSGFAEGGFVTGGQSGVDSVPAMLTPGELVLTPNEVPALRKLIGRFVGGEAASRVTRTAGGDPGGKTIIINQKTELRTWTPNITEETKMARRLENRGRKQLAKQGMLLGQTV